MNPKISPLSSLFGSMCLFLWAILINFALLSNDPVSGELFTAQVDLEPLFPTQQAVIEAIEIYLAKEDVRLQEIRRRINPYVERGKKNPQDIIDNPISAFLLVKGLTIDLEDLMSISQQTYNSQELNNKISHLKNTTKFPVTEDLNGAAVAITRLQDTYDLETADIAKGVLGGHCCADTLHAEDLFELGRQSYNGGDFDHTILWMHEALIRYQEERHNATSFSTQYRASSESDILEYLAFSTYQKGEIQSAIRLTQDLLRVDPAHPRATGNIVHYERMIDEKKQGEDGDNGVSDRTFTVREKRDSKIGWEKSKYESLCRGEGQAAQPKARCRYYSGNNPYLRIGPVKEEVIFTKPMIWIYHDIISDREIDIMKRLARPRFKRATVHDHATGELVTAQYRISKSSWLQGQEHPAIDTVNKRITAITGLDLDTAEELQVVNYGLGGHYEPHFDFARRDEKDAFKSLGTGNRIATFLIYMTDVEAGGATVFPSLDLTLYPVKGAAAFWYNLFEDGVGDVSTRHAACPVLLGSKWVANKWIHERGQEFRRPCNISPSLKSEDSIY